jgi:hypothetical protein
MEKALGQYIMSRFIICRLLFVKYYRGDQNDVDMGGKCNRKDKKRKEMNHMVHLIMDGE